VLPFGELMVEIDKTKDYVMISEGKIYKKDLEKIIDFFTPSNRPSLLKYKLEFSNDTIKFGCKIGSYSELLAIYNAM
jgi:hypothetical protein